MKVHHIAWYKRSAPDNHGGGVPLFGHYLARCFGAQEWSWSDFPKPLPRVDEPTAAQMLSHWLLHEGKLIRCKALVVDGFWGRGLTDEEVRVSREFGHPVVCVAHGTWRGIARATGSRAAAALGDVQAAEYARLPVVAVSERTAQDLRELYGVEPVAVIRNGVDTDEFRPRPKAPRERPVIIYPSDAPAKGGDVVAALKARCPQWEFRLLGAGIGQEAEAMAQGDVFLAPSRYEGCSYAALQALACGLPVVVTPTGMFAEQLDPMRTWNEFQMNGCAMGAVVNPGLQALWPRFPLVENWEGALGYVLRDLSSWGNGRHLWARQYGSLTRWQQEWQHLLDSLASN